MHKRSIHNMTKKETATLAQMIAEAHNTFALYASYENLKESAKEYFQTFMSLKDFAEKLGYTFRYDLEKNSQGVYTEVKDLAFSGTNFFYCNPSLSTK